MEYLKKVWAKVSAGGMALVVAAVIGLTVIGCTLPEARQNAEIGATAVPKVLEAAEPILGEIEKLPIYEGVNPDLADKAEHGLSTTAKNLGRAKAVLTIGKAVVPGSAAYIDPAIQIIGLLGTGVIGLLGFVERRKRKTAERVTGVVMKAVNPINGVGAVIVKAAGDDLIADEVKRAYRKHVEA